MYFIFIKVGSLRSYYPSRAFAARFLLTLFSFVS